MAVPMSAADPNSQTPASESTLSFPEQERIIQSHDDDHMEQQEEAREP